MIQLSPQTRILVAAEPVDFRKGIDGLAKLAKERLRVDPLSGCVFVFNLGSLRRRSERLFEDPGPGTRQPSRLLHNRSAWCSSNVRFWNRTGDPQSGRWFLSHFPSRNQCSEMG